MQAELTINTPSTEWRVYKHKTFSVTIRAWNSGGAWSPDLREFLAVANKGGF